MENQEEVEEVEEVEESKPINLEEFQRVMSMNFRK
tara:strand:+ start:59 stop:163 length:105 start_codon:yes stop_codon:yes gene_type:complete